MHDPHTKTAYSLKPSPTHAPEDTAKFAAHGGPHSGAMKAWGRLWPHHGSPDWSRLLAGPVTLWGTQAAPEGQTLWKGPTLEQFVKNCSLRERLMLEKFVESCLLWEEHSGAEKVCEEKRVAEIKVWRIDCNPHSLSPCATQAEKSGVKLSLWKTEGLVESILRFGFISHYPILIWFAVS